MPSRPPSPGQNRRADSKRSSFYHYVPLGTTFASKIKGSNGSLKVSSQSLAPDRSGSLEDQIASTLLSNHCALLKMVCQTTLVGETATVASKGILAILRKERGKQAAEAFLRSLLKLRADGFVRKARDLSDIIRDNSLPSILLSNFAKREGLKYLKETLRIALNSLLDDLGQCEIDPQKLERDSQEDMRDANERRLIHCCQTVLSAILESRNSMPASLRRTCHFLHDIVDSKGEPHRLSPEKGRDEGGSATDDSSTNGWGSEDSPDFSTSQKSQRPSSTVPSARHQSLRHKGAKAMEFVLMPGGRSRVSNETPSSVLKAARPEQRPITIFDPRDGAEQFGGGPVLPAVPISLTAASPMPSPTASEKSLLLRARSVSAGVLQSDANKGHQAPRPLVRTKSSTKSLLRGRSLSGANHQDFRAAAPATAASPSRRSPIPSSRNSAAYPPDLLAASDHQSALSAASLQHQPSSADGQSGRTSTATNSSCAAPFGGAGVIGGDASKIFRLFQGWRKSQRASANSAEQGGGLPGVRPLDGIDLSHENDERVPPSTPRQTSTLSAASSDAASKNSVEAPYSLQHNGDGASKQATLLSRESHHHHPHHLHAHHHHHFQHQHHSAAPFIIGHHERLVALHPTDDSRCGAGSPFPETAFSCLDKDVPCSSHSTATPSIDESEELNAKSEPLHSPLARSTPTTATARTSESESTSPPVVETNSIATTSGAAKRASEAGSGVGSITATSRSSGTLTVGEKVVGSFLFLWFFVPGVVSPDVIGLLPARLSPQTRRGLVLTGKILTALCNDIEFGDKEKYLVPLNGFLRENRSKLKDFLNFASIEVPDIEQEFHDGESDSLSPLSGSNPVIHSSVCSSKSSLSAASAASAASMPSSPRGGLRKSSFLKSNSSLTAGSALGSRSRNSKLSTSMPSLTTTTTSPAAANDDDEAGTADGGGRLKHRPLSLLLSSPAAPNPVPIGAAHHHHPTSVSASTSLAASSAPSRSSEVMFSRSASRAASAAVAAPGSLSHRQQGDDGGKTAAAPSALTMRHGESGSRNLPGPISPETLEIEGFFSQLGRLCESLEREVESSAASLTEADFNLLLFNFCEMKRLVEGSRYGIGRERKSGVDGFGLRRKISLLNKGISKMLQGGGKASRECSTADLTETTAAGVPSSSAVTLVSAAK